jgi:SdpC family antimicrobial peptide
LTHFAGVLDSPKYLGDPLLATGWPPSRNARVIPALWGPKGSGERREAGNYHKEVEVMHRSLTKRRQLIVTVLMIGPAGFLMGCSGEMEAPAPLPAAHSSAVPGARFSGEAIVRGLFFGEGQAAKMIPEIWEGRSAVERASTVEQASRIKRAEERVLASMRVTDPGLVNFSQTMQSGDHLAIDATLRQAADQVLAAVRADPALSKEMSGHALEPQINVDVYAAATVIFFVVFVIAALAFAVAPARVHGGTNPGAAAAAEPSLQHDEFVDLLATRLATK